MAGSSNLANDLFKELACSGAITEDIFAQNAYEGHFKQIRNLNISDNQRLLFQQTALDNFIPGREAQIKFLEKYKPRVATIGIGGNDIGFADKLKACVTPLSNTCEHASTDRQKTAKEIYDLYGKLKDLYTKLRKASPTTRLYAVGYPQIVTMGGNCGLNVQLDLQEQEYAVFTVDYLDRTIKAAASAAGINYLDVEDSLAGTNLCSSWAQPSVNGITKGNDIGFRGVNVIGNESYHPNEKGHALMAAEIRADLSGDTINTHDPCAVNLTLDCNMDSPIQPAIPAYFGTVGTTPIVAKQFFSTIIDSANEAMVSLKDDLKNIAVNVDETLSPLKSFTTVQFTLHSDPTPLGTYTTDANGKLSTNITIPYGVTPGYHTVTMHAMLISGDEVEFYQPLLVLASLADGDGDGIVDTADPCPFVASNGVDVDHDGIDDACDGYINPDSVSPIVTGAPVRLAGVDGWYNQDVTIDWTATDPEPSSGIVTLPVATTATLEGMHDYNSAQVCDNANNCTTGTISLKIDKTAPALGSLTWTQNPKPTSGNTTMSISANDAVSGISEAEYFIGETDPGVGHGATMTVAGDTLSTVFGTDFPTGVYKISVRAKDKAGNWSSVVSDYLVVYNPSSSLRITGQRSIVPSLSRGDILPGLISMNQKDEAKLAFNVMYDKHGQVSRGSDLRFTYKTGSRCENPKKAINCHIFDLNATYISWLTTQGLDRSTGIFQGIARLKVDGASRQVQFRVTVVDGSHLILKQKGQFELKVFAMGADPNTAEPLYQVGSSQTKRGNIIISTHRF